MLLLTPLLSMAQIRIGLNLNVGHPEFYGQIDLENAPPPQVIYSTPMVVEQGGEYTQPLYLRVPEEYHRHWPRYCSMYNACRHPVYFVREDWYANEYAPHYRQHYPQGRPEFVPRVVYSAPQEQRYDERGEHRERYEEHEHHQDHDRREERRDDDRR